MPGKPTAAPWKVYDQAEDEGGSPDEFPCAISSPDPEADWVAINVFNRADARLIAAAPDLLEACKHADMMLILLPVGDEREEAARIETRRILAAVIAKAEGK